MKMEIISKNVSKVYKIKKGLSREIVEEISLSNSPLISFVITILPNDFSTYDISKSSLI